MHSNFIHLILGHGVAFWIRWQMRPDDGSFTRLRGAWTVEDWRAA